MKHIHFVTDDDLFDQKAFGKVKNICYVFFMNNDELSIIHLIVSYR